MSELGGFSNWVLALLPRLFLYPGGAWMVVALLGLRFVSGGLPAIKPPALVTDLVGSALPSLAVSWVALSLVPLPGAPPLAASVDMLTLIALLLVSVALAAASESAQARVEREGKASVALALALLAPIVRDRALLGNVPPVWGVSGALSILCVTLWLLLLAPPAARDLAGAVRWLTWLGLGYMPVLAVAGQEKLPAASAIWTGLTYALSIGTLALAGRLAARYARKWRATITSASWGLSALALIAALLGY